jgi:hypothetical protein
VTDAKQDDIWNKLLKSILFHSIAVKCHTIVSIVDYNESIIVTNTSEDHYNYIVYLDYGNGIENLYNYNVHSDYRNGTNYGLSGLHQMLVLPLWNPSIHSYTFLCIAQFHLYCANILLWISEGFTPSDSRTWMTAHCSTTVQSESGANIFILWLHDLHWM